MGRADHLSRTNRAAARRSTQQREPRRCAQARALVVALSTLSWPQLARADGSYGRLEGDTSASVELGARIAAAPRPHRGAGLAARGRFLFLHSLGVVGQYDEGFGLAPFGRSASGSVELRPMFLARWASAMEGGPARADLIIDSIALTMGVYGTWPSPSDCLRCPDFGMESGVGFEVPFFAEASTPYVALRAAVRWTLVDRGSDLPSPPATGLFTLTIGYRQIFTTHLVDLADRLER